jgi:hypothetical protein
MHIYIHRWKGRFRAGTSKEATSICLIRYMCAEDDESRKEGVGHTMNAASNDGNKQSRCNTMVKNVIAERK